MNIERIGFIGGGRVTRILLQAFRQAGVMPHTVVVYDPNEDVLRALGDAFPEITLDARHADEAAGQQLVVLSLHPPVMPDVLPGLAPSLHPDAIVLSLAPRLTLERLAGLLGGFDRLVRMIPNAPSIIGKGYNPVAYAPSMTGDERSALQPLFAALGACPVVPEEHLEAYAITTAMGPTYLWFQLRELARLAHQFGLSEQEAAEGVAAMARGAVATLFESGMAPEEVMDLVPVKPLADQEAGIVAAYDTKLEALYAKLKN